MHTQKRPSAKGQYQPLSIALSRPLSRPATSVKRRNRNLLENEDIPFLTNFVKLLRPDRRTDFTKMRFPQE